MFSRDFTLVNMEIWYRGEVLDDKIWTNERQPFLPYIVFEKTEDSVNSFYDPRGIKWIKNLLLKKVKSDNNFLFRLEKNFLEGFAKVKNIFDKQLELNHKGFCQYLELYEQSYVWFEAAWWLWDMNEKELGGVVLPDSFKQSRETTQDYVPKSELVIRKSLAKIYPELKEFVDVLRIFEIVKNNIPDISELVKRKRCYYFLDNKLFTKLSRKEIEKKYNIKFETFDTEKTKEFVGESAYKGKVSGKVKIVLSAKTLDKVKNGDILVSGMTLPDFLPAIQKSVAMITDEGGMLSHAAITAREMKKPCIIGTKIATKVLKDGDVVEVDADKGVVKIIKKV